MDLRSARRIAAAILGVGTSRIVFAPEKLEDIRKALTRDDIRALIRGRAIMLMPKKGVSRARARARAARRRKGRGRGPGRRKGGTLARRKARWIARIRAQRALLRQLKKEGKLLRGYREIYLKIKGGVFKDRAHLMTFLKEHGLLKEEEKGREGKEEEAREMEEREEIEGKETGERKS